MINRHRLERSIRQFWINKCNLQDETVEMISQQGFFALEGSAPPQKLVAVCSLSAAQKPIHEVIKRIQLYAVESAGQIFNGPFFMEMDQAIDELELAGLRSHARNLRKLGSVIASMNNAVDWKDRWANDTHRRLVSAIRDEPFLPQRS